MYGIIFKTIQEAVLDNFDENTWNKIIKHSKMYQSYFISTVKYQDELLYKIVESVVTVLKIKQNLILALVGKYWISNTAIDKYIDLMSAGGNTLRAFLENLPFLHNRIIVFYPKISEFDFEITTSDDESLKLNYITSRSKLQYFFLGALKSLVEFYSEETTIELVDSKRNQSIISSYQITWA
jgi:hypothetical protein